MARKQKPMRPETAEEIAKYRRLGLVFTANVPPDVEPATPAGKGAAAGTSLAQFLGRHGLTAQEYRELQDASAKNGRTGVLDFLGGRPPRNSQSIEEIVHFLSRCPDDR